MASETDPPPASEADPDGGWRPAHDDSGPRATAHRARRALRISVENRADITKLRESVDKLSQTIEDFSADLSERWGAAVRFGKFIGAPIVLLSVTGAAIKLWSWLSTLHH